MAKAVGVELMTGAGLVGGNSTEAYSLIATEVLLSIESSKGLFVNMKTLNPIKTRMFPPTLVFTSNS
jgi:hypothetical protein